MGVGNSPQFLLDTEVVLLKTVLKSILCYGQGIATKSNNFVNKG